MTYFDFGPKNLPNLVTLLFRTHICLNTYTVCLPFKNLCRYGETHGAHRQKKVNNWISPTVKHVWNFVIIVQHDFVSVLPLGPIQPLSHSTKELRAQPVRIRVVCTFVCRGSHCVERYKCNKAVMLPILQILITAVAVVRLCTFASQINFQFDSFLIDSQMINSCRNRGHIYGLHGIIPSFNLPLLQ